MREEKLCGRAAGLAGNCTRGQQQATSIIRQINRKLTIDFASLLSLFVPNPNIRQANSSKCGCVYERVIGNPVLTESALSEESARLRA
jgi:hypothetical protein